MARPVDAPARHLASPGASGYSGDPRLGAAMHAYHQLLDSILQDGVR